MRRNKRLTRPRPSSYRKLAILFIEKLKISTFSCGEPRGRFSKRTSPPYLHSIGLTWSIENLERVSHPKYVHYFEIGPQNRFLRPKRPKNANISTTVQNQAVRLLLSCSTHHFRLDSVINSISLKSAYPSLFYHCVFGNDRVF